MTETPIHPLLIRGEQITEHTAISTLKEHPHKVAGRRRGFEVRIYHYPAEGWDPYFVTMTSMEGWMMGGEHSPTAAAAEAAALEMLNDLARPLRSLSASDPRRMVDHADRVDRLTQTLIATIEATGVSSHQAQHALAQTLGAVIGSNACNDAHRAAAVSRATSAIGVYAGDSSLLARHGRKLHPAKSRLN